MITTEEQHDIELERQRASIRAQQNGQQFNNLLLEAGNLYLKRGKLMSAINYQPEPDHMRATANSYLLGGSWTQVGGISDVINRRHLSECSKLLLPGVEKEIAEVIIKLADCAKSWNFNVATRIASARTSLRPELLTHLPADIVALIHEAAAKLK